MIQVWKTLHEKDDINPGTWFTPLSSSGTGTRMASDPWNLVKPHWNLDTRQYFWSVRSVDNWNNLPTELKGSSSVNTFKNNYDKL